MVLAPHTSFLKDRKLNKVSKAEKKDTLQVFSFQPTNVYALMYVIHRLQTHRLMDSRNFGLTPEIFYGWKLEYFLFLLIHDAGATDKPDSANGVVGELSTLASCMTDFGTFPQKIADVSGCPCTKWRLTVCMNATALCDC